MGSDGRYCVVCTTCGARKEAERIAEAVVVERLGACVQIEAVTSCYRWEGALHREPEWRLTIKTRSALYSSLRDRIAALHSYTVPEIVRMPLAGGSAAYLAWIDETTGALGERSRGARRR